MQTGELTREGRSLGRASSTSASLGTLLLVALMPKCPLCVAAALTAIGLGTSLAGGVAPFVRPLAIALVGVSVSFAVYVWYPSLRRHRLKAGAPSRRSCCA
jgi:hypothetical protein